MRGIMTAIPTVFFCVLTILAAPAHSAQLSQMTFNGNWKGGAYSNDQTGEFSHCAAYAPYRSGITMFVAINRNFGWTLAFGDPAWKLRAGETIPLSMTFDGENPWSGVANVMSEHMAAVPMAENSALINAFRGAYVMHVEAAGQDFVFNLDGTSRLMVELARCVQTQLAIERGEPPPHYAEGPPRTLNPSAVPPAAPQNTALELEATRIASNLLLQAALPHARLLSPSETPATLRGRGAAWTSDAGPGAIEIVPAATAADANQLVSQLIASDSAACKGDFASGRSSDLLDDKVVTKAFTGCKDSTGSRAFRYFIVEVPTGDFVIYELTGMAGAAAQSADSPTSDTKFQTAAVKAAFSP